MSDGRPKFVHIAWVGPGANEVCRHHMFRIVTICFVWGVGDSCRGLLPRPSKCIATFSVERRHSIGGIDWEIAEFPVNVRSSVSLLPVVIWVWLDQQCQRVACGTDSATGCPDRRKSLGPPARALRSMHSCDRLGSRCDSMHRTLISRWVCVCFLNRASCVPEDHRLGRRRHRRGGHHGEADQVWGRLLLGRSLAS